MQETVKQFRGNPKEIDSRLTKKNVAGTLSIGDGSIVVSIVAFQAIDPGSIPGHRSIRVRSLNKLHFHFDFVFYASQVLLCNIINVKCLEILTIVWPNG